jgi:hypothetical protein
VARRNELADGAVADHDFRAKAEPHEEAGDDQPLHGRAECARQRRSAEQHEIELVTEFAAEAVAEQPGAPGPDHHAQKSRRDERRIQGKRRFP